MPPRPSAMRKAIPILEIEKGRTARSQVPTLHTSTRFTRGGEMRPEEARCRWSPATHHFMFHITVLSPY